MPPSLLLMAGSWEPQSPELHGCMGTTATGSGCPSLSPPKGQRHGSQLLGDNTSCTIPLIALNHQTLLLRHLLVLGLDRMPWMGEVLLPLPGQDGSVGRR